MAKVKSGYVDHGREMPAIRRSECIVIPSKELAELACQQMGLKPPVCPLSKRPRSYSASGWVWDGTKFVQGVTVSNNGMLVRQPIFRDKNFGGRK
jgi:hypothetical protein